MCSWTITGTFRLSRCRRLADLDASNIHNKFAELSAFLESEIASLPSHWNATRSINQLPHEILSEIAAYMVLADRCAMALVCQHWRAILLSATPLWTDLAFKTEKMLSRSAGMIATLIARSKSASLRLSIDVDSADDDLASHLHEELCEELCSAMERVTIFKLRAAGLVFMWPWCRVISTPAPRLEELYLAEVRWRDMPLSQRQLQPFSLQGASRLRHLYLHGLVLNRAAEAAEVVAFSRTVTSFTQLGLPIGDHGTICDVLACFPEVQQLTIVASVYDAPVEDELFEQPITHSIQRLRIGGHIGASRILSTFYDIPERYASFWRKEARTDELATIILDTPELERLDLTWELTQALEGEASHLALVVDGRRVAVDVLMDHILSLLSFSSVVMALRGLKILRLPADVWYLFGVCLALEELEELTLLVDAAESTEHAVDELFGFEHWPSARLPSLMTLGIEQEGRNSSTGTGQICDITLEHLIKTMVLEDRLEYIRLVLRGIVVVLMDPPTPIPCAVISEPVPARSIPPDEPWYCFFHDDHTMLLP